MKNNNPFFHRGPIQDSHYFWNRTEELEQARLLTGQGQSVSIVGPRRIGKSSMLFQLAGSTRLEPTLLHWVYFNCEGWSAASPESLYALLADSITSVDPKALVSVNRSTATFNYREFRDAIMHAVPEGVRLVWLLDEFEVLSTNPRLNAGFFSGLRALVTTGRVTFVTASSHSLGRLTFSEPSVLSSPFFNIFTQIRLYPFAAESAAAMIRHLTANADTAFADATVDFVLNLAGPHPFFAQIAAYYVYERIDSTSGELTTSDRDWVRDEFLAQVEPHWQYAWLELAPIDRKQVALSLDRPMSTPDLARRLRSLALIVEDHEGWRLLSPELRAFFAKQPVEGLVQALPLIVDPTQHRVLLDGYPVEIHGLEYELLLSQDHIAHFRIAIPYTSLNRIGQIEAKLM